MGATPGLAAEGARATGGLGAWEGDETRDGDFSEESKVHVAHKTAEVLYYGFMVENLNAWNVNIVEHRE
jgi:hypothetical protein